MGDGKGLHRATLCYHGMKENGGRKGGYFDPPFTTINGGNEKGHRAA